jgi:hypothetical protein
MTVKSLLDAIQLERRSFQIWHKKPLKFKFKPIEAKKAVKIQIQTD